MGGKKLLFSKIVLMIMTIILTYDALRNFQLVSGTEVTVTGTRNELRNSLIFISKLLFTSFSHQPALTKRMSVKP